MKNTHANTIDISGPLKTFAYGMSLAILATPYSFSSYNTKTGKDDPEGYIKYWGKEEHYPYYYIKDHLHNVCAVWDSHANGYTQTTFYYPSGVPMSISTNQAIQPNKYNGKPYEEMHGMDVYEYEFRNYYATIMRFTAMDPLCEQTPWQSPYVYAANNPVCNIDGMGLYPNGFQTKSVLMPRSHSRIHITIFHH